MKIDDKVERNGEFGTVMHVNESIAYIWWHTPGKYKWEPCDITTLKSIMNDQQIDKTVEKDALTEEDVCALVDWVLYYKSTLGVYRDS